MMLTQRRHQVLTQCLARHSAVLARSEHFLLYNPEADATSPVAIEDLIVVHDFRSTDIDNNLGYHVANELLPLIADLDKNDMLACAETAYRCSEQETFERYVGEIVRSMDGNEARAWHLFYDNTLRALVNTTGDADAAATGAQPHGAECPAIQTRQDFIGDFAAIYAQALTLIDAALDSQSTQSKLLDVATCFGFFPLFVNQLRAGAINSVHGCDHNPALVNLANGYARQRGQANVRFAVADVLAHGDVGLWSCRESFDVVTAIHLLEHLEPEESELAIANLWYITGRRLIISVPLEAIPDRRFGHRQVFDQRSLSALGQRLDTPYRYFENRGGWLVIDRENKHKQYPPNRRNHHAKISH